MPYPTSVRLPEDVRRVLRKVAKQNRRSVTEQINFVLQEWVRREAAQREHPPASGKAAPEVPSE
jgi:hypothetical protein